MLPAALRRRCGLWSLLGKIGHRSSAHSSTLLVAKRLLLAALDDGRARAKASPQAPRSGQAATGRLRPLEMGRCETCMICLVYSLVCVYMYNVCVCVCVCIKMRTCPSVSAFKSDLLSLTLSVLRVRQKVPCIF